MAEAFAGGMYDTYGTVRSRSRDDGLLAIALAGPPDTPPEIVRVHGGLEVETVDFSTTKQGGLPTVPHPKSLDPNMQFLTGNQVAKVPMTQVQGTQEWTIAGSYTYVHRKMVGLDSAMPTGVMPFDVGMAFQNTIPASCFSQNVIGSDAPPTKIGASTGFSVINTPNKIS